MNRYGRAIVLEFTSQPNREFLAKNLNMFFNDQRVFRFLQDHLNTNIDHFAGVIEQEILVSDPMPGVTISDQVQCFNNQFINDRINFIRGHVLALDDTTPVYVIKDGMPTSRNGLCHYQKQANDILDTWRTNSGRGIQAREDPAGDVWNYDTKSGLGISTGISTGITICDQSGIGLNNHQIMYENTVYKNALNKDLEPILGVSTPESDNRILSRRIFRSENGVENGISRRQASLHKRYVERDVRESMSIERDCAVRGHDMQSLYDRVDAKNKVKTQYGPSVKKMNLNMW